MSSVNAPLAICPECGEAADRHTELIPVERQILDSQGKVLVVEGLISEKGYEFAEREQLLCPNGHGFPIPPDLELRYV